MSRIAAKAIYGDTRLRILATDALALAGRLKDSKTFYDMVKDSAAIDRPAKQEGRNMFMILTPKTN